MNYYNEIKEQLIKSEIYDRVKDYSKDRHKVKVYFEIGRLLNEAGKEYGKNVIKQYAEKLIIEVGKKYNERTLYGMRKFFEVFNNEKENEMDEEIDEPIVGRKNFLLTFIVIFAFIHKWWLTTFGLTKVVVYLNKSSC